MNFIIGARGRLGKKLISALGSNDVVALDRQIYENWWNEDKIDDIVFYFDHLLKGKFATIFVASGILEPSKNASDHYKINYLLPKNVIQAASKIGLRIVTFGTIMEEIINNTNNPYIQSKILLGDFISRLPQNDNLSLHIRIHTLYGGGPPNSFMFLGQILQSLNTKSIFKMSSGEQLREYLHIDDAIIAISFLLNSKITGIVNLSHGQAVSLKQLALHTFNAFNCSELLRIGAIAAPDKENYEITYSRTVVLNNISFRDSLTGIVEYLSDFLAGDKDI